MGFFRSPHTQALPALPLFPHFDKNIATHTSRGKQDILAKENSSLEKL